MSNTQGTIRARPVGKGSSASIYATPAPVQNDFSLDHNNLTSSELSKIDSETTSSSSSTSSNISTPTAISRDAHSSAQAEGSSYLDAQPSGQARPLLDRINTDQSSEASPTSLFEGSTPMTPARRRLLELDYDGGSRSPGSRSVHLALTSPSTARTPLAETAPLPETPLKHGHDDSTTATPTRSSIVERRRAPAMPPLSPPSQNVTQEASPRGLGLGLTPTKQSTTAFFGGSIVPAMDRRGARSPGTPSSRTNLLEFDVSGTDGDDSLSFTGQDIESSLPLQSSSSAMAFATGSPGGGRKDPSTARGSAASRWADPEQVTEPSRTTSADSISSPSTLLSRFSSLDVNGDQDPPGSLNVTNSVSVTFPHAKLSAREAEETRTGLQSSGISKSSLTDVAMMMPSDASSSSSTPSAAATTTPALKSVGTFDGPPPQDLTSQLQPAQSDTSVTTDVSENVKAELPTTSAASPTSTDGQTPASPSPMPHIDWADEDDDDDELPDLNDWGLIPPSSSSPAVPENSSTASEAGSSLTSSTSAPVLPPHQLPQANQGGKLKKGSGRGKKMADRTAATPPMPGPQSKFGGIRIAGIASAMGQSVPSGPRRELLPGGGPANDGPRNDADAASKRGPRGKGASGPGGGAWLHDMVQGPPPVKRTERPKPQLAENGTFSRLAKGIVGIKSSAAANGEHSLPVASISPPRNVTSGTKPTVSPSGASNGGGGGGGGGGKAGKGRGHPSPRKTTPTKGPTKARGDL